MYYLNKDNFWRDDLDDRTVMVTIRCITYNHEEFIRDALEGFVNQKTNFRFEAIVHDDASTDNTAKIIREYAEKYPSIIKPIFETENQYSKPGAPLRKIMDDHMRGKYIAMCEGDDFWTDSYKLQKQFDYLESHPDYSLVFHPVLEKLPDGKFVKQIYSHLKERDYSPKEIFEKWTIPTCSAIFKKESFITRPYDNRFTAGDIIVFLNCGIYGKIHCLNECMGVYRRTYNGWILSVGSKKETIYKGPAKAEALIENFPLYHDFLKAYAQKMYAYASIKAVKNLDLPISIRFFIKGIKRFGYGYFIGVKDVIKSYSKKSFSFIPNTKRRKA